MKPTLYLAVALLEVSLAAASSIPKVDARQLDVGIGIGLGGCDDGFHLGPGHHPPPGFDFFDFCSSYLQATLTRTSTVTATTYREVTRTNTPAPVVTTSTRYSTISQTSVVTVTTIYGTTVVVTSRSTSSKPTVTSPTSTSKTTSSTTSGGVPGGTLCPTAGTTPLTCGVTGWGYAENNIYYAQPVSAAACHQLCLARPECNSFQVQADTVASPECNLYKTNIAPNTIIEGDSPFIFYDRNCPDYSPPTCKNRDVAQLVKKDESAIPPWLIGIDPFLLEELCECLVPFPPEPTHTTITRTTLVTRTSTTTVQGPTSTSSLTVTVGITRVVTATTTVARSTTVTRTTTIIS